VNGSHPTCPAPAPASKPMRVAFGEALIEFADAFPRMVVLDADCSSSTQTKLFAARHPDRFFNFGIAEANMVAAAAGMAAAGLIPVASSFAFLLALRAGDAVRSLVAYGGLNVKLVGGYAGLSDFADGASHQSVADLAVMTALPNMAVVVPSDLTETRLAVRAMLEREGPVYLRLSREAAGAVFGPAHPFEIGRGIVVREGADVTLAACGRGLLLALEAADELAGGGISARVLDLHTVKPLDAGAVEAAARETGAIVTVEEHNVIGGLGSAVSAAAAERYPVPVLRCGIPDRFGESGPYAEILARAGLSAGRIADLARRALALKRDPD